MMARAHTVEKIFGLALVATLTPAGFVRRQVQPRTPLPAIGFTHLATRKLQAAFEHRIAPRSTSAAVPGSTGPNSGTGAPAWAGAKRLPGGMQALPVLAHRRGYGRPRRQSYEAISRSSYDQFVRW